MTTESQQTAHPADISSTAEAPAQSSSASGADSGAALPVGKRKGNTDPIRYGDWELNGRCIDF